MIRRNKVAVCFYSVNELVVLAFIDRRGDLMWKGVNGTREYPESILGIKAMNDTVLRAMDVMVGVRI